MFKTLLRTSIARPTFVNPMATRAAFFSTSRLAFQTQSADPLSVIDRMAGEKPTMIRYTPEHEWVAIYSDHTAYIGITKYAADALGDVTFVELPEIGDPVEVGDSIGSIESVKSASEIYSPVNGEVIGVNTKASGSPSLVNEDPTGEGWIAHIKLTDSSAVEADNEVLMTEEEYTASIEEE